MGLAPGWRTSVNGGGHSTAAGRGKGMDVPTGLAADAAEIERAGTQRQGRLARSRLARYILVYPPCLLLWTAWIATIGQLNRSSRLQLHCTSQSSIAAVCAPMRMLCICDRRVVWVVLGSYTGVCCYIVYSVGCDVRPNVSLMCRLATARGTRTLALSTFFSRPSSFGDPRHESSTV